MWNIHKTFTHGTNSSIGLSAREGQTMIMRKEEYDDVMAKNRDMCKCGHIRMFHSVSDDGRESTWCCKFECECKKFTLDKQQESEGKK